MLRPDESSDLNDDAEAKKRDDYQKTPSSWEKDMEEILSQSAERTNSTDTFVLDFLPSGTAIETSFFKANTVFNINLVISALGDWCIMLYSEKIKDSLLR